MINVFHYGCTRDRRKKIRGMRYFKVVLKAEDVLTVFSVSLINVSFNFMKLQAAFKKGESHLSSFIHPGSLRHMGGP